MTRTAWGLETIPAEEWLNHAACTPATAHFFEVVAHGNAGWPLILKPSNEAALDICATCPVTKECLEAAIASPNDDYFIAGGKVIHHGEIIPARRPPRPDRPSKVERAAERFASTITELLDLGWTSHRIAGALGIDEEAVVVHQRKAAHQ